MLGTLVHIFQNETRKALVGHRQVLFLPSLKRNDWYFMLKLCSFGYQHMLYTSKAHHIQIY